MITYKKIETLKELDKILPMIESFHKTLEYCQLFPHSAYLLWLIFNFRTPAMGVWVCYDSFVKAPVGYIIATIEETHTMKEVLAYEAFSRFEDEEIKQKILTEVMAWGKSNGCIRVSMFTENEKVMNTMVKRYGFRLSRYQLVKEV